MTDQTVRIRPGGVPGTVIAEGYATGFGDYDRRGPNHDGWIERIDREVFLRAAAAKPEADLTINFEGWPLARTKSGSLALSVDDAGLRVTATLLETDPDVARMLAWMDKNPGEAQFSFAYKVPASKENWEDGMNLRVIKEITIERIGILLNDPEFLR